MILSLPADDVFKQLAYIKEKLQKTNRMESDIKW